MCPPLKRIKAVGSDGEDSLINAIQLAFPDSTHLRCFIHVRDDLLPKLTGLCFSASAKQEVIRDIFGWKVHSTYYQGLLDSQSSAEFYEKLGALKPKWDRLEKNKSVPEFHDWVVKYQAVMMVNSMIAPVCESAGLCSSPEQYTQNHVESMNRVLKDTCDYHKMTWMKCCRRLSKLDWREHCTVEEISS